MDWGTEGQALAALYEQCGGKQWRQQEGWLAETDVCTWEGVTCTQGRVTRLVLARNRLHGTLPAELGLLAYLTHLDLAANQLSGSIPAELGNLRSLTVLNLADNELRGTLPPRLRLLHRLRVLDLHGNALTGPLPAELHDLMALERLDLSDNRLTGQVPAEWGRLGRLTHLALDHNELFGPLPPTLQALTSLERLAFDATHLLELPDPAFQAWLERIPHLSRTGVLYAEVVTTSSSRGTAALAAALAAIGTFAASLVATLIAIPLMGPLAAAIPLAGIAGAGLVGKRAYDVTSQRRAPQPAFTQTGTADPDARLRVELAQTLRALVRSAREDALAREAHELVDELEAIQETLLDMLSRMEGLSGSDADAFTVRQTIRDYLPAALDAYRAMPSRFAAEQPIQAGRTAQEHVVEQIRLMHTALKEIDERLPEADVQRLLVHGRFLEDKFGERDEL
jgi:hypothetical protein